MHQEEEKVTTPVSAEAAHEHCWHTRHDAPSFCCRCIGGEVEPCSTETVTRDDQISRKAAVEAADARLRDIPSSVDLEANLFAAGYLAAAGSIKAALGRVKPSTATTSSAVEAANAAATEICDWCGVDSNDAERVAAIISRHFPPTAIPAAETPQTFGTTKEAMLHAQRQGLPTVVPAEDRSTIRANAIDEAIKLEPHVYMDYAATTINSESKKVAHDVCRTYAAALEALKQGDGRRSG